MKKHFTLILFLAFSYSIKAQKDSVEYQRLADSIMSTAFNVDQLKALNDLAWNGKYINIDITQNIADYVISKANQHEFKEEAAFAYKLKGITYDESGLYSESVNQYLLAIKNYEELNDSMGVAKCEANIGMIYRNTRKWDDALVYFRKSMNTFLKYKFDRGVQLCLSNMGICHLDLGNIDSALFFHQQAFDLMKKNDQEDPDVYGNLALAHMSKGDFDKAREYLITCISIIEQYAPNDLNLKVWYQNLGTLHIKQGNYKEAAIALNKSLELTGNNTYTREMTYLLKNLANVYSNLGDYKKSNEFLWQLIDVQDSIYSSENLAQINDVKAKYETEKKELEIEKLNDEKKIEQLGREKEEAKSKIFFIGLILALVLIGFVSLGFFLKIKDNKLIKHQNKQIENQRLSLQQKNDEILSSIEYAKRIQTAILPPDKLVKEYLTDSFIFYRPKDIVAGDFYWMDKIDNTLLFAVADCTGHGVPGAMVSVVCHNALNRSVREFGFKDPGKILDKTRELIADQFAKSEENVRDGMDIALVAINYDQNENQTIYFSGANNPLWLIRDKEIIELKGMKQPVGKFENMQPFESQKIDLNKGDLIYLFSDGYGDQFGGDNGKKFKSGSLKKLLVEVSDLPMADQKIKLEKVFDSWKGELEQLDDICIIGVRM